MLDQIIQVVSAAALHKRATATADAHDRNEATRDEAAGDLASAEQALRLAARGVERVADEMRARHARVLGVGVPA